MAIEGFARGSVLKLAKAVEVQISIPGCQLAVPTVDLSAVNFTLTLFNLKKAKMTKFVF